MARSDDPPMTLLTTSDATALREKFDTELSSPTRITYAIHDDACVTCERTGSILREVADLSPRLTLARADGSTHLPSIRISGAAKGVVRFTGLPSGHEFPTFIDALVGVSSGESSLPEDLRTRLVSLRERVHIRVFTTPT